MNNMHYFVLPTTAIVFSLLLSSCQLLTGYNQIDKAERAEVWSGKIMPMNDEVNIACAGTYHCEITKIDKTLVISTDTHRPFDISMLVSISNADGVPYAKLSKREQVKMQKDTIPLVDNKSVVIVPLSASSLPNLVNYYARVKPIKREIHVNYYPENNTGYVERFAIIHEFKEPGTYMLQAYRHKSSEDKGSLLDSASPSPLCIDLLQDNQLKRRFCKRSDNESQGEFVENDMVTGTVTKAKVK